MPWKRGTPGCCECEGCLWTFVTRDSCTFARVPGSLVSVSQGGIEIATCTTAGVVASLTIGSPGTSYTSLPSLAITGGGGSGATGTLDMELESITRTSGGSGYTNGSYTGTFTGGGGTGGTFGFSVSGGAVASFMFISARGSGYTSLPTPDFSIAGPGTGAAATVALRVKSVTLTAGGSGYTSSPTVAITGGGGSGATATAVAAAQCTLNVPAGDYDVVVTPPAGAPYDAYSDTLTHTCSQTTTVTFDLDPDSVCGNCGPCTVYPKVLTVTWSGPVPGATFTAPDDVLTLGASIGGFLTWYGATGYADPFSGFGGTARLIISCSTVGLGGFGIANKNDASASPNLAFGNLVGMTGALTCSPFAAIDANANSAPGYVKWSVTG